LESVIGANFAATGCGQSFPQQLGLVAWFWLRRMVHFSPSGRTQTGIRRIFSHFVAFLVFPSRSRLGSNFSPALGASMNRFAGLLLITVLLSGNSAAQGPSQVEPVKPDSSPKTISVSDGTPVPLRFAQAMWGLFFLRFVSDPPGPPFRIGDTVRLVAAADVMIGGQLVIRRGSPAQATLINLKIPDRKSTDTGLELRLDWIKTINDQQLALRPFSKHNKWKSIWLDVYSDHGGFFVDQSEESLAKGLFEAMTLQYMAKGMKKALRQKLWVPAGTRITGFVKGSVSLDVSQLAEARARFPLPNSTGLLTIYRMKGQADLKIKISCDENELGQLAARQYFVLELEPGKHFCNLDKNDPVEFNVSAGADSYFYLHSHALTGKWSLELVDSPVGEDGIAEGELVAHK
jgi:hypothetical protein